LSKKDKGVGTHSERDDLLSWKWMLVVDDNEIIEVQLLSFLYTHPVKAEVFHNIPQQL
jgi:hypothetical protein